MALASGAIAQDTTLQRIADALEVQSGSSEIIAPREASSTSEHPYAVGEQFLYGGKLYTATSSISTGDTIVTEGVEANCIESGSIVDQIGVELASSQLSIGATSVTFTNSVITTSSKLDLYCENSTNEVIRYTGVTVSNGSATYTFPALTVATTFYLEVK